MIALRLKALAVAGLLVGAAAAPKPKPAPAYVPPPISPDEMVFCGIYEVQNQSVPLCFAVTPEKGVSIFQWKTRIVPAPKDFLDHLKGPKGGTEL